MRSGTSANQDSQARLSFELGEDSLSRLAELVAELNGGEMTGRGPFLDVSAAAEFLSCPTSRIYALVSARRIPHHRDGTRLLFNRGELRDFVLAGGARRP